MLNAVTLRLQLWKLNLILINPGAKLVLAHAGIALDISESDRPLRCTSPVRFWGGQNQTCWKKKSRRASTVSESSVSPRSARSIGLLGAACSRASLNRCPGLLVWNYSSVQNELENVEELFFCESYRRRETYCTYACLQSVVSTPSDSARTSSPTFKPRLSAMSELQSGGFQLIVFVI